MPTKQNKIRYKVNKIKVTDNEINKHKDFGKLIANYQKATRPITKSHLYKYKNRNIFMVILIILLLLWLLFYEANKEEQEMNEKDKIEQSNE